MTLVEPVTDGEDVRLVGPVWVDSPGFNVFAEVCFEFCVPLWTAGRYGCFMGEQRDNGCAASKVYMHVTDDQNCFESHYHYMQLMVIGLFLVSLCR